MSMHFKISCRAVGPSIGTGGESRPIRRSTRFMTDNWDIVGGKGGANERSEALGASKEFKAAKLSLARLAAAACPAPKRADGEAAPQLLKDGSGNGSP